MRYKYTKSADIPEKLSKGHAAVHIGEYVTMPFFKRHKYSISFRRCFVSAGYQPTGIEHGNAQAAVVCHAGKMKANPDYAGLIF